MVIDSGNSVRATRRVQESCDPPSGASTVSRLRSGLLLLGVVKQVGIGRMRPRMQFRSVSAVAVIRDRARPEMAVTFARTTNDEPIEKFPFRIARRR